MTVTYPRPGDFGLTQIDGTVGRLVKFGQWLNGDGFHDFQHAFIYVGEGQIIEAQPGGAVLSSLSRYQDERVAWSSGCIEMSDIQRGAVIQSAFRYLGTPYSVATYISLATVRLGVRPRWLRDMVSDTDAMICSQYVDQCFHDGGLQLFDDQRIPGDVTPGDLAYRIGAV